MTEIGEEETQLLFVIWPSFALLFAFNEDDSVRFLALTKSEIELIVWKEPPRFYILQ